jgi:putative transposase
MRDYSSKYSIKKMAEVLEVSRSCYYAWLKNPLSKRKHEDIEFYKIIKKIYDDSRQMYGSPSIHRELKKQGYKCARKRTARIMRQNGIYAIQKKKFIVTTDSGHDLPLAPNLLNREFCVDSPNKVWVSDITYIWTMEGWLYLCIILDLWTRKIVGWSMNSQITSELVISSLTMAIMYRNPEEGLLFHSDRGVQYVSDSFLDCLDEYKMIQSMSRKANCWDNACAESFFATLKTEEVYRYSYKTREDARSRIFEYIAVFYNRHRRHSFLDYLCPEEFELKMGSAQNAA